VLHSFTLLMAKVKAKQLLSYFSFMVFTTSSIHRGTGYCFRSISLFVYMFISLFLCLQDYEKTAGPICIKFSGKVRSDHGTTWVHFSSIPGNRAMHRCATRGRGLLCFSTTACFVFRISLKEHYHWTDGRVSWHQSADPVELRRVCSVSRCRRWWSYCLTAVPDMHETSQISHPADAYYRNSELLRDRSLHR